MKPEPMSKTRAAEILGVPENATQEAIRSAWRKQSLMFHPDKGGSKPLFQLLSEAHDMLCTEAEPETPEEQIARVGKELSLPGRLVRDYLRLLRLGEPLSAVLELMNHPAPVPEDRAFPKQPGAVTSGSRVGNMPKKVSR